MARQWSARCYGVARQRDGSHQNSIGVLRRAFSPAFRAGSLYPLARGCRRSWRGEGCNYGLWLRRRRRRFRSQQLAEGAAFILSITLTREGAAGQAVVCPLLRGSSPTRGVAPKQHRTRRLLTNRPCSSLVYEESDSKERLRVSNWIVQRLYNYAVKKTVEL